MKLKITLVIVALIGGVAFLAGTSIKKDARKFYQLTELQEAIEKEPDSVVDKYLVVLGNVKEGSIKKSGIEADFVMQMENASLKVHHNGKNLLPDTFQDGAQVTVEGKYSAAENLFVSDKVMAKCASKYESGQKMK